MRGHHRALAAIAGSASIGAFLFGLGAVGGAAQGVKCQAAGTTGLTAAVIARPGQVISGSIDAHGCDVGVYVGPNASRAVIQGARITGAGDHGILVEGAAGVVITQSVVVGNGVAPHACPAPPAKPTKPCVAEDKGIELVGTRAAVVSHNVVVGNLADGGIGIADEGPIDPGGMRPGALRAAVGNEVLDNTVAANRGGCGIVAAAYNAGAGVLDNLIEGNTVTQNPAGIVVAADTPHTRTVGNRVIGNTSVENALPGIIVHSNAPFDAVIGTQVLGNTVSGNGAFPQAYGLHGPKAPTGIIVVAEPLPPGAPKALVAPQIAGTQVVGNVIGQEAIPTWVSPGAGAVFSHNTVPARGA